MMISLSARGDENPAPADSQKKAAEAARYYLADVQRLLESRVLPNLRQGIIEASTTRPASLAIIITDDPSPYHNAVTTDKAGAIVVQISLGYLAMHDAALDAVALSGALKQPEGLRRYLRYQLTIARDNEMRTKQGRERIRTKHFADFLDVEPVVVQSIFAHPQWQRDRETAGVDSLGWVVSYLLVLHDRRLSGDNVAVPASASAAKLADAAGFFPAPPFPTAYHLEEVTNPGQQGPSERRLICRAADFLDAGSLVLRTDREWQQGAADNEVLRNRIQRLREDVARMRRDARCAKRDSAEA